MAIVRKLVILGTTGSGKTTFLRKVTNTNFQDSEVRRRVEIEEAQILNTFTPLDRKSFEDSTTTVAMNAKQVLFAITLSNQLRFHHIEKNKIPDQIFDDAEGLYPLIILDLPGQERFDFIQDIGLKGADAALIFADGTNIQSIERVWQFAEMVEDEMKRSTKKISIVVVVNKKDMESKGYFIGSSPLSSLEYPVFEVSNYDLETFTLPLRTLLDGIAGFPISVENLKVNLVHKIE